MSAPSRSPLERGLAILELLAKWHGPVSLEMVTNELKVNKSTAFRLLDMLEKAHLVTRTGTGTGYLLGSEALVLGEAFKRHFAISGLCRFAEYRAGASHTERGRTQAFTHGGRRQSDARSPSARYLEGLSRFPRAPYPAPQP